MRKPLKLRGCRARGSARGAGAAETPAQTAVVGGGLAPLAQPLISSVPLPVAAEITLLLLEQEPESYAPAVRRLLARFAEERAMRQRELARVAALLAELSGSCSKRRSVISAATGSGTLGYKGLSERSQPTTDYGGLRPGFLRLQLFSLSL